MQEPAIIIRSTDHAKLCLPDGRQTNHRHAERLTRQAHKLAEQVATITLPEGVPAPTLPDPDPSLPPYHVLAARNKQGRTAWQTVPAAALDDYPHLRWPTVRSAAPTAILDVADAAGWRVKWEAAP